MGEDNDEECIYELVFRARQGSVEVCWGSKYKGGMREREREWRMWMKERREAER